MFAKRLLCSGLFALVGASAISHADDTELYLVDTSSKSDRIPKVLIVFDNSYSMSTIEENTSGAYSPDWAPDGFDYSGFINEKAIYWNRGGIDNTNSAATPLKPNESRRFNVASNGCAESWKILEEKGRYTGYIREFRKKSWEEVADNNGLNDNKFDCLADIRKENKLNATGEKDGFPVDKASMYSSNVADSNATKFGEGQPITLYTSDYLIWYQWVTGQVVNGTPPPTNVDTRLNTAKNALKSALETLGADIEVGLAVFNLNSHALSENDPNNDADFVDEGMRDGGRIVSGITQMTDANQSALFTLIDGMPAETNTPLCETLFEAHQYLSGGTVVFGDKDSNTGNKAIPSNYVSSPLRDPLVESNGSYISPFKTCPEMAYIIYMTDGEPTVDHFADGRIKALTDAAENKTADYSPFEYLDEFGNRSISYLPALASYMYNNDLVKGNLDSTGNDNQQSARLYTIGFSEGAQNAAPLLLEAAKRGGNIEGGGYYEANSDLDLTEAFNNILKTILSIDSSYTSPSIASNNFDKTQTFNSAYYAMFLPSKGPRWAGNLKKLKVTGDGVLVKPGKLSPVVDDTGNISPKTCTFWSKCESGPDGNKVKQGGAIESLQDSSTGLLSRRIFVGTSENLYQSELKNQSNASVAPLFGFDPADSVNVKSHVDWIYGLDVDDDDGDNNFAEGRADIMGDPLHSKPLALNFGTKSTPDVRIILGTNQGLVHMFRDYDKGSDDFDSGKVEETWAYIPPELMKNIPILKANIETGDHSVYGMDSSPVAYTKLKADGQIETAWVYMGMRRGGKSYYALDVSNPDNPKFMWQIKAEGVFWELGQTWSEPVVTSIPMADGDTKPVLIFGGGFDDASDLGNAVYIVDAESGTLIKKISAVGMDSIPNKVAILDSNNDGVTDRIYASDVSANIWRIDLPTSAQSSWSVFKFASLEGGSQRMFFNEPVVAQTTFTNISEVTVEGETIETSQRIPYDAVTIGSGNRAHPLDKLTQDTFFVLQDRTVVTTNFNEVAAPDTIEISDLYDVTSTPPSPDNKAENILFGTKNGWFYHFSGVGEKSLAGSLIFDGKVYFTSFIPPSTSVENLEQGICGVSGKGRLYVFDLHKGARTYNELYFDLGERVPDTPQIVVPAPEQEGDESKAYIIGIGKGECENGECKGTIELGSGLGVNKIYYHIDE
ncbi:PilC/PilY family type IV pilus protein [Shewanella sp. Isolate7]|uniref:pilus assembly protein n=1 Tax=Shewanella sp. Isolate7 TaxID=2908528 RepID=UPI001EFD5ABC|nr:PilC/PilY family type IV pilus protein [Shewanella sp. Isolate7]MCG9720109.1 type IV pilin biogenesis protein [Shewanella sp. Isolate7]